MRGWKALLAALALLGLGFLLASPCHAAVQASPAEAAGSVPAHPGGAGVKRSPRRLQVMRRTPRPQRRLIEMSGDGVDGVVPENVPW